MTTNPIFNKYKLKRQLCNLIISSVTFAIFVLVYPSNCNSQTLKIIFLINNKDLDFVEAVNYDHNLLNNLFQNVANSINYDYAPINLSENNFTRNNLNKVLDTIQVSPDDILAFFYSGHGYNYENSNSDFPTILFDKATNKTEDIELEKIYNQLKDKNARLTIAIGDLCNNLVQRTRSFQPRKLSATLKNLLVIDDTILDKLFLDSKGSILISSSKKGQRSGYIKTDEFNGSYFTISFNEVFENITRFNTNISWDDFIKDCQIKLNKMLSEFSERQEQTIISKLELNQNKPNHDVIPFTTINDWLNKIADENLTNETRRELKSKINYFLTNQAKIKVYKGDSDVELKSANYIINRLYLNAKSIEKINMIEKLSTWSTIDKKYTELCIEENWQLENIRK